MSFVRPRPRRVQPDAQRFQSGPWRGVRTTTDPMDDVTDLLYDAENVYNPDAPNASGWYARPGMSLLNDGTAVHTSATPFRGQGVFYHTDLSTTVTYNFVCFGGTLYRVDEQLSTFTDVTPSGVTIDSGITTRVYGTSFGDQFIITDGVNKPWLASDLDSTPITGTEIEFNAAGDDWSAFGPFVTYGGSAFCIVNDVGGTAARTDIAWSAAGDASLGYQQSTYDNRWTLLQTETDPLFALAATNVALFYFRGRSIGAIQGAVGPDLQTSATHDAVSLNVGTQTPQSVVQFGTMIYFVDALGRPYRLIQGADPEPIWLQMRGIVDEAPLGYPAVNRNVATASFDPTLNLYIVAPFTCLSSQQGPPVEGFIFDARTATYFGRFSIADGVQIDCLGVFVDAGGRGVLVALGSDEPPTDSTLADSGFVWSMNALSAEGDFLTTEDGDFLTTEDDVTFLTSEGIGAANWQDDDEVPTIFVQTGRMGYGANRLLNVDRAAVLVGTTAPCAVSMQTAAVALTAEGTPTPSTVQDGVSRLTIGADGMQGRGVEVKVSPTTADEQWSVQGVTLDAIVSGANPDEV